MAIRLWLCVLIVVSCCFSSTHARKYASIVIDADSGVIHHQANCDVVTYPASLTKMMTLYLTFKALNEKRITFNQPLKVSKHASRQAPSKLWLKPGTTITVKQAIFALITKSANDVAVVLAEALGGTEAKFAQTMTQQAHKLGMTKTTFKNASGLPNRQQVTTARDMALLSRALYHDFPEYFKYFKQQTFVYKGQRHHNHNKLLGKVKGVDGIKTGYINASGFNLAASVIRQGKRVIAVVMGGKTSRSRDKHMTELLEGTYKKLKDMKDKAYMTMNDLLHSMVPGHSHTSHKSQHRSAPPLPPLKDASLFVKEFAPCPQIKINEMSMPLPPQKALSRTEAIPMTSLDDLITSFDEEMEEEIEETIAPYENLHPLLPVGGIETVADESIDEIEQVLAPYVMSDEPMEEQGAG